MRGWLALRRQALVLARLQLMAAQPSSISAAEVLPQAAFATHTPSGTASFGEHTPLQRHRAQHFVQAYPCAVLWHAVSSEVQQKGHALVLQDSVR